MSLLVGLQVEGLFGFLCHVLPLFFVSLLGVFISREFYEEFRPKHWKNSLATLKPFEPASLEISNNPGSV